MTGDDRLEELSTKGARAVLTRGERIVRGVLLVTSTVTLALVVGFFVNKQATSNVAACTNQNLGARDAPNKADRQAQDDYNAAQNAVNSATAVALTSLLANDGSAKDAVTILLSTEKGSLDAYGRLVDARAKDDAARAASPLGKC